MGRAGAQGSWMGVLEALNRRAGQPGDPRPGWLLPRALGHCHCGGSEHRKGPCWPPLCATRAWLKAQRK